LNQHWKKYKRKKFIVKKLPATVHFEVFTVKFAVQCISCYKAQQNWLHCTSVALGFSDLFIN